MRRSRGGGGGWQGVRTPPPPEKSGLLQYLPGSPENHKATTPAFNVGPPWAGR